VIVVFVIVHEVLHGALVATTISFAIIFADGAFDVGMTKFFAILDIGATMIIEVFAGTLNPIVKSPTLNVAKFARRLIPGTFLVAWRRRTLRCCECFGCH